MMSRQRPGGHRRITIRPSASQGGTVEDTILVIRKLTFDTLVEALKPAEMLVRRGYQTYDFVSKSGAGEDLNPID